MLVKTNNNSVRKSTHAALYYSYVVLLCRLVLCGQYGLVAVTRAGISYTKA